MKVADAGFMLDINNPRQWIVLAGGLKWPPTKSDYVGGGSVRAGT